MSDYLVPRIAAALVLAALALAGPSGATPAGGRSMLKSFDYRGVTLDGGRLRQQVEEVRAAYLRIPNDDLLKPYRLRAGKPAPGADLKGAYIGHGTFGQHISGLARLYAATGDVACKEKAKALLAGWAACMEPDGYALQAKPIDLAPYHVEKLIGGLVDMIAYCGETGAVEPLLRLVAWSEANLAGTEKHINATDGNWYVLNGEWYTLAENFYRAYEVTRDARCLKLARRFEYTDFWEIIRRRANPFDRPGWKGWYHAYSHVNSFCGAGPAYRVSGEARYLETLKAAYDFMQQEETYATGGFGPGESLIARADLAASLERGASHFETQCGSWAGFKLCKYLLAFTGDARYGDWAERLLLNGVGATIPMDPEGCVFYYSDYNLGGGVKKLISDGWPCCSGTRIELTADYHDLIFMHDDETLYAVQFAPATVEWKHRGARVQARQQTRFPEEEATELTVQVSRPREFSLAVRLPEWLAGEPKAWVNGKPMTLEAGDDHWGRVRRVWRNGDTLRVSLPMSFRLSRIDPAREFPVAIMRGPVALAVRPTEGNPSREVDTKRLDATLKPVPGQPLNYRTGKDAALLVRPFSQFAAGEPYFLYLDPVRNFVRRSWVGYAFTGAWSDFGEWQTSASPGSVVQVSFSGIGVRVHGFHYDDAGMFQVEIDGKMVGTLDEYGPVRGDKAHWDFAGLAAGRHMLRLTVMDEKNAASKGRFCNLANVEGLP